MLNNVMYLKAGALVLGAFGMFIAIINVFIAIAMYEEHPELQKKISMLAESPEYVLIMVNIAFSIVDLLAAVLLIAGILMKRAVFLLPYIVLSMTMIILDVLEYWIYALHSVAFVSVVGGVVFIWYCILKLYKIMKSDEEKVMSSGVQMTYVEKDSAPQPYSVLTTDK